MSEPERKPRGPIGWLSNAIRTDPVGFLCWLAVIAFLWLIIFWIALPAQMHS